MENLIDVTTDKKARLITFKASGFWDAATVDEFRHQMAAAAGYFHSRNQSFDVLADMTHLLPQSQLIVAQLQESLAQGKALGMRRTACLASRQLTKIQFSRIATHSNFVFFDTKHQARVWLRDQP